MTANEPADEMCRTSQMFIEETQNKLWFNRLRKAKTHWKSHCAYVTLATQINSIRGYRMHYGFTAKSGQVNAI